MSRKRTGGEEREDVFKRNGCEWRRTQMRRRGQGEERRGRGKRMR